ncbi:unnamed protein product [marine sediment metagenome]|uniref:Uncharacterized protein n=1 Tax=marine sediment metagenome TaxID=412755 RepID=X0SF45_9ZZZZ
MKDGGPAFPSHDKIHNMDFTESGMSLRDRFAGMALTGMLGDATCVGDHSDYATAAYKCADAMIAEREKEAP